MHKKFEINQTKIKGSCQSGRKVVPQDSKSALPLVKGKQAINKVDLGSTPRHKFPNKKANFHIVTNHNKQAAILSRLFKDNISKYIHCLLSKIIHLYI